MKLRPYQSEDVEASIAALERHDSAIYTAATGLGKSVVMAALAKHTIREGGRVLVLSDRCVLADQLAVTFEKWTGGSVGVEQGERIADTWFGGPADVVIAMVQTLYSGGDGEERFRKWRPDEFDLVIVDEAEAFIAPTYRQTIEYFKAGGAKVWGCTATPMRSDGKSMGIVFDHALPPRDIRWAVEQGYLVPPRSADVEVELDRTLLKTNREGDYSNASVARMIAAMAAREEDARSFARGVLELNDGKRGILVAPKVNVAQAIADYLHAEQPGVADVIYGELSDDRKNELFIRHQRGDFPILSSCDMLTKGYDDPALEQVFVCRPTRSRRLFIQIVGRGLRLLDPEIGNLPDADARKQAIADSDKPHALIACMVPLDADTRDMTVADALDGDLEPEHREKLKQKQQEQPDKDTLDLLEAVKQEVEEEKAEERRRARALASTNGKVKVTTGNPLDGRVGSVTHTQRPGDTGASLRQIEVMRKAGVDDKTIAGMTAGEAGRLTRRILDGWKNDLCSYGQAKVLRRAGYGRDELHKMDFQDASIRIDTLAKAGWKLKKPQIESWLEGVFA